MILRKIARIVLSLRKYITQDPQSKSLDLPIAITQIIKYLAEQLLVRHNGIDQLILIIVCDLVDQSVAGYLFFLHVRDQVFEGEAALVDVVCQDPEILWVVLSDVEDLGLAADEAVAGCDYCHLADFVVGHLQVRAEIVLELLHYLLPVGELGQLLHSRQREQALIGHMRVNGPISLLPSLEHIGITSSIVGNIK